MYTSYIPIAETRSFATHLIKIFDKKGNEFLYYGKGDFFPFYSSFAITYIPKELEIKDIDVKDTITSLSMEYSRLSVTKTEEILEKFEINLLDNKVSFEHHGKNINFFVEYKDRRGIQKALSSIDFYSFHPYWINEKEYVAPDETQPYYKTRYSMVFESKYGRKSGWNGFFTSYDLPNNWSEIADEINRCLKYADEMECLRPDLAKIGRTDENTIYGCNVVFPEGMKPYLYIAPDASFYPGMKVYVPVGVKNNLTVATIKSLRILSKEKDAETINKCRRIHSHFTDNE